MKKIKNLIFLIVVASLLFCQSSQNGKAAKEQVKTLITNYSQAFDEKNFQQFISYCSDDFRFYTLDGQIYTKEQTVGFLTKILQDWEDIHSEIKNLDIRTDTHLAMARYTIVYHNTVDGVAGTMTARITAIFIKNKTTWQLMHFHMSRRYV